MLSLRLIPLILCCLGVSLTTQANETLKADFDVILNAKKGPFGDNMLQGSRSRVTVKSGASPSGTYYFQAAFRNESARKLAEQGFFTGNLFTTNYFELTGEYVYQDKYGSFELAHDKLNEQGAVAMPKAVSMVQNWVLEKYFAHTYPDTNFAKSFVVRGISGSEFEQPFAKYFFNFYLANITDDYQYLPAFLLAKESPITDSAALANARDLITTVCNFFNCGWSNHRGLWDIRNAIHNQMSENVIAMINTFLQENPWYEQQGHTYLQKIRTILIAYYSFNAEDLAKIAKASNAVDIQSMAENIVSEGVNEDSLMNLSEAVADYKSQINASGIQDRAGLMVLLIKSSQYLNAQLNRVEKVASYKTVLTLLNAIYIEGFLIKDNWDYYRSEINNASVEKAMGLIPEIVEVATDTFTTSFDPAYGNWKSLSLDSKFENFIDDTVKSSALNNASLMVSKQ